MRDLESLGLKTKENMFLWEENAEVNPHLKACYPYGMGKDNNFNNLAEYCWQVYKKSKFSYGPMRIGRASDLWKPEILAKYCIAKGDTLWAKHTRGNILVMDKWAATVNDAWVLGGIHRYADFHLMSYLSPGNLWNYECAYHIVTAREILGLLSFSYEMTRQSNTIILKCMRRDLASNADLRAYASLMKKEAALGTSSINKLLTEPVKGLYRDIIQNPARR